MKTMKWMIAIAAAGIAIPAAMAQTAPAQPAKGATMSSDLQVITPAEPKKMTAEEKKADKAAKRKEATKPAAPSPIGADQQVVTPKAVPKMTAEEKKADKAAKRKAPTAEEQAKQAKQTPGG